MRSGDARAHWTNSLSASLREGGGFGMQKSLGPRNAAMFCISTKTAPCAKPSQKLTAAVPIALSGAAVQRSTKSAVVAAPKFASVAACGAQGASNTSPAATVHPFNVMTAFPSDSRKTIADQLNDGKSHYRNPGPQVQNEPNTEPSAITAASAIIGPTMTAITMSK